MNTVYSLAFFECDLNNPKIRVSTDGPTPFLSKELALKHLLNLVKPQLRTLINTLVPYENKADEVHSDDDFENLFSHFTENGEENLSRLTQLYFKNIKKNGFYTGYRIDQTRNILLVDNVASETIN